MDGRTKQESVHERCYLQEKYEGKHEETELRIEEPSQESREVLDILHNSLQVIRVWGIIWVNK